MLRGDRSRARRNEPVDPSIQDRVNRVVDGQFVTTQPPTTTNRDGYAWAAEAFTVQLEALRTVDARLGALENALEAAGAPWTPGRFPAVAEGERIAAGLSHPAGATDRGRHFFLNTARQPVAWGTGRSRVPAPRKLSCAGSLT